MTYRIVQWATGAVGRTALRSILQHPELDLAGVLVYDPAKEGVDAGDLVGMPKTGILATRDRGAILDLSADCVLHMPLPAAQAGRAPADDERDICDLLASGKNVITVVGFLYPKAHGPELVARLEGACQTGSSSLHGTGANPGFVADVLPLFLSGLCTSIDHISIRDAVGFDTYPSPGLVFDMMGFGKTPGDYERDAARWQGFMRTLFSESLHLIADAIGVRLNEFNQVHETELASEDFTIAAGTIAAGTVAAQRWVWSAVAGGEDFISIESIYRGVPESAPNWPSEGLEVVIGGIPALKVRLGRDWLSSELKATAGHAINAIPHVCSASPGIQTALELPLVVGWRNGPA